MRKKYLLAVQGEGRGHMTQAITLFELLREKGHEVCAVIVGSSGRREIPSFMYNRIDVPIIQVASPNFVSDKKNKSINIPKSVLYNFGKLGTFRNSIKQIDEIIAKYKPDTIINFFDLMIGLYFRFKNPIVNHICIAHQYIYLHPGFKFPGSLITDQFAIKLFTKLTASRSSKQLALSFYDISEKHQGVVIVPPLLRSDIFQLNPKKDDFFLIYLVNNGYFEEIVNWHKENPNYELHCFTDDPSFLKQNFIFNEAKLFVHAINDKLFLEKMSQARGLASTAGFESVCEAMFLGKPVLMVPVKGHFEQYCNSRDAHKAGAGIFAEKFDLNKLLEFSTDFDYENVEFKNWLAKSKQIIYEEIVSV
jgi:uncharacterized protein (TIGR00661 family)